MRERERERERETAFSTDPRRLKVRERYFVKERERKREREGESYDGFDSRTKHRRQSLLAAFATPLVSSSSSAFLSCNANLLVL